jgi:uncharacterized membrane protein YfbV (UPF0208 family)
VWQRLRDKPYENGAMLRLTEIALLVLPLAAFLAWRFAYGGRPLPAGFVLAAALALVLLAVALVWYGTDRALPNNAPYSPARLHDGQLVEPQ